MIYFQSNAHQVIKGSTVEPLATLPRSNRLDPQLMPPAISEEDARLGILSLIQRGLIPPAAELTLDPSPVKQRPMHLHDPKDRDPTHVPLSVMNGKYMWNQLEHINELFILVL